MRNLMSQNSLSKIATIVLLLLSANSISEAKPELDTDLKLRAQMVQISKELGVTCTFCHNSENFKDSKNKNFITAKDHFRVLAILNSDQGFKSKPKVTCYTCHKGQSKFEYMKPESADK